MSRGTWHISIRVPPETRDAAKTTAEERGDTLSEICRLALVAYHHNPSELLAELTRLGTRAPTPADPAGNPPTEGAPTAMRREQLEQAVTEIVQATFDTDLAEAITGDDAFGALVGTLRRDVGDDYDALADALANVANGLEDRTVDWLVDTADSPAAFIASRI